MDQLLQSLIDRTRSWLDVKRVQTIFGAKKRPYLHQKNRPQPRFEVGLKKPAYDLTIFKLHFGKLSVKLYAKGERILRCEAIAHNTKALHCGRSLPKFPQIVIELEQILLRFLEVLDCVNCAFLDHGTFDQFSRPGQVGAKPVAGIDLSQPRLRTILNAVIALAASPQGITVSALAAKARELSGLTSEQYKNRHAAYDLRKLRGKHWAQPVGKSRRYQATTEGLRTMTALLVLRQGVLSPLLAGATFTDVPSSPSRSTLLGDLYQTLQAELLRLFQALGVAGQTL